MKGKLSEYKGGTDYAVNISENAGGIVSAAVTENLLDSWGISKEQLHQDAIPQIMNKIYPEIKNNIESSTTTILNEYERMLTEKLESLKGSVIDAEQKKKEKTEDFIKYKEIIKEDLSILDNFIKELR